MPRARAHPAAILPDMARRLGYNRGGARRRFGALGMRVCFQRQEFAMRAQQFVFVEMPGAQARHENLPEPAGMPLTHRHAAAIPCVEIADDADPLRVGRPDRKRNAFHSVMQHRVRAELLITREMIALDEQMHVEFAENGRETVDVVEFMPMTATPDPQPVAERR